MAMNYSPGPRMAGLARANDPTQRLGVNVLGPNAGSDAQGGAPPGANVQQQRTFALMERISAAYRAWRYPNGQPADTDPTTLDTGESADTKSFDWAEFFKVDNTRLQVYGDVDEMDETTDEVAGALDILSDSAINPEDGSQRAFVVEINKGPYEDLAAAIFAQVTESLDLQDNAFTLARNAIKYGDCFFELVVDETGHIARGKILPAKSVHRNEDAQGNLVQGIPQYDADGNCQNEPGDCAFDQREQMNGKMLAAFEQWQICHIRWNRRGSDRYGRSMLRTARLVWKKLKACEEAIVIARLQRAWMRFVHHVDTTGMSYEDARMALNRYRQDLTRRYILDTQLRENPYEVTSDFFISDGYLRDLDGTKYLPKKAEIKLLQGDHAPLAHLQDIEYFQSKLFASLRVPKAYLGFERDVNAKATLTTQDIQFARILRRIQGMLSVAYKQIFDFALILAGIDPTEVEYTVRWPAILVSDEERDAIIRRLRAEADATYWQMGGISTKYLVEERYGFDDEAWEANLTEMMYDPPPRLKVTQRNMPDDTKMQGTGVADVASAIAGSQVDDVNGSVERVAPLDQYAGQNYRPGDNNDRQGVPAPLRLGINQNALTSLSPESMEEGADGFDGDDAAFRALWDDEHAATLEERRAELRRRMLASRPRDVGHASPLSVVGVHGVHRPSSHGPRGTGRGAERVRRVAAEELAGFVVDLGRRKLHASERIAEMSSSR